MFAVAMSFFSSNELKCVSMNNQECKVRPELINVSSNEPPFYPYSVKKVNVVAVVIISMIHMQTYVLLMLLKTWMLKYLI